MRLCAADGNVVEIIGLSGEVLHFDCSTYDRTKYTKTPDVFLEVNRFLEVLQPSHQNLIFEKYREFHKILTEIRSNNGVELAQVLTQKATELYQLIDINSIHQWVGAYVQIEYPPSVFATVINELNPEKTYIRSDYDDLIVLTLAIRFMMPIWGAYNKTIIGIVGKQKEYHSYKLLANTEILNHSAIVRLSKFIHSMVDSNIKTSAMIIQGQGTEELPEWILASLIVKRLSVADFKSDGGLVKNIFTFVKHVLSDLDGLFGGIRAKHGDGSDDDGSEYSQLEKFRGKPPKSTGETIATGVFVTQFSKSNTTFVVEDPIHLAKMIDDTIDPLLVSICFNSAINNPITEIHQWQLALTQYVIYPIISPTGVAGLSALQLSNIVMVVAQALMIHWGFLHLGLLVKAVAIKMDVNEARPPMGSSRITANTLKELMVAYPYILKNQANDRQSNIAYKAINELNDLMIVNDWDLIVPPELVQSVNEQGILTYGQVPSNVREMIALLVLRLNLIYEQMHVANVTAKTIS